MSYRCSVCSETHDVLPDIGMDKPDYWWSVPEDEREKRTQITEDTCIIDDEDFFIRGVIEIPVHDHPHRFGFGYGYRRSERISTPISNTQTQVK